MYILLQFGPFFPVLVSRTKNNLAPWLVSSAAVDEIGQQFILQHLIRTEIKRGRWLQLIQSCPKPVKLDTVDILTLSGNRNFESS
jgi:hypothetical protein